MRFFGEDLGLKFKTEHELDSHFRTTSGERYRLPDVIKRLEWESFVGRDNEKNVRINDSTILSGPKVLISYKEHEQRLKSAGYERGPMPQEVFALMLAQEEGVLNEESLLDHTASDIITDEPEFTCCCLKGMEKIFTIYEKVKGIHYRKDLDTFMVPGGDNWYERQVVLDKTGLPSGWNTWSDINEIHPEIIDYFFNRKLETLPMKIKRDGVKFEMWIPENGEFAPIVVGNKFQHPSEYCVCPTDKLSASRGVRYR